jgi:hypothetical protein
VLEKVVERYEKFVYKKYKILFLNKIIVVKKIHKFKKRKKLYL